MQWIGRAGVWAPQGARRGASPLLPGMLRLSKGVLCAALHLAANAYFPVSHLESSWFPDLHMFQK